MAERVATLSELRAYRDAGLDINAIIDLINDTHGVVKVFDHTPKLMGGHRFRYFVMPLDKNGKPLTKIAKGANL